MGKKKKIYDSETGEVMEENDKLPIMKPSQELIDGFCDTFLPCAKEGMADETFTMGKLREYFQCYKTVDPRWIDQLQDYIEALVSRGFSVKTSYTGEPAIFVMWNNFPLIPDKEEDDDE